MRESRASQAARLLRAIPSERRKAASRENGKLGGRPRGARQKGAVKIISDKNNYLEENVVEGK